MCGIISNALFGKAIYYILKVLVMSFFALICTILTFVAFTSYINERFVKFPTTIGVIVVSLILSFCMPIISYFYPSLHIGTTELVRRIDFQEIVFHGFLGLLLFASAMHVKLSDLKTKALPITLLATVSVVISTFVVGYVMSYIGQNIFYLNMPTIWYYVFGALISPTDPVAVLAIMKKVNTPKEIEIKVAGESLFNDGSGIVVYTVLLAMAVSPTPMPISFAFGVFLQEAFGGLLYGFILGLLGNHLISKIDSYEVETMITLAMATAGYLFAEVIHVSAPLAIVMAGLIVGNFSRGQTMSSVTEEKLFGFWSMLDELLNLTLFTLMGLYVMTLNITIAYLAMAGTAVAVVLIARFISVSIPITMISMVRSVYPGSIKILTWGGLKGAISIALVLALPDFPEKEILLVMTYGVVMFSMIVQGLTVGRLIKSIQK